jgi:hypothetical protein
MTDMVRMSPDDFSALSQQMRMANTQRLKAVLDSLEPYIDGSLGAVSPPHVNAYIKVCRELGLMWDSYGSPRQVEEVRGADEEQMVLQARQEAVMAELGKLREVGMRNTGRRAS